MKLSPLGWVIIRTPVLAFEDWFSWTKLSDPVEYGCVQGQTGDVERQLRIALLKKLTPAFLEILFFASPDLYSSIRYWLDDPNTRRGQATENHLVAFLSRMATRATPFGLCAGYTLGTSSHKTSLELAEFSQFKRSTTVDIRPLRRISWEQLKR